MYQTMRVLMLCLFSLGFLEFSAADSATDCTEFKTNILFAYNQLDNKLERHEHRERVLGEIIKKSLQSLQQGLLNLQLQYGSRTSLDGRVSQIENQLKTQEERFCSRLENLNMMKPSNVASSGNPYAELLTAKLQTRTSVNNFELDKNVPVNAKETATHNQELCTQIRPQEGLTSADKEFIQELASETRSLVERVHSNVQSLDQRIQDETVPRLREVNQRFYDDIDSILKRFNTQEDLMQKFYEKMNTSFNKVNAKLEYLSWCNRIAQPLTQAVATETSNKNIQVIDKQQDELLDFLKTRFDTVDKNITNMQLEIAKHLNTTIQNEATYLWRQISITNGEISQSKDLLRLMRDRNDIYVNSVLQSMSSMSNRVEDMKERIMDLNDNQNDLLKKLPWMSQEFSDMQQAFIGLLERLSETLKLVQEKKK